MIHLPHFSVQKSEENTLRTQQLPCQIWSRNLLQHNQNCQSSGFKYRAGSGLNTAALGRAWAFCGPGCLCSKIGLRLGCLCRKIRLRP
jgi:hypothetical protein